MPAIADQDDVINTEVGGTVVLRCQARGAPRPVISWFRDGSVRQLLVGIFIIFIIPVMHNTSHHHSIHF